MTSLSDDEKSTLVDTFEAFLRGGGRITFSEWADASAETKAALVAAGEKVRLEQAALIGLAAQGKEGLLEVFSKIDGGEMKAKIMLSLAMDKVQKGMEKA